MSAAVCQISKILKILEFSNVSFIDKINCTFYVSKLLTSTWFTKKMNREFDLSMYRNVLIECVEK